MNEVKVTSGMVQYDSLADALEATKALLGAMDQELESMPKDEVRVRRAQIEDARKLLHGLSFD